MEESNIAIPRNCRQYTLSQRPILFPLLSGITVVSPDVASAL